MTEGAHLHQPTFQVLISTMHRADYDLLDSVHLQSNAVVVNQCDTESVEKFEYQGHRVTWINTRERGLSKSRNMALQATDADICLLMDDDEVLCEGYVDTIIGAFNELSDASVIGFKVEGIEKQFKVYGDTVKRVGIRHSMKMASVEIAFKIDDIRRSGIRFNERIGTGTKYLMGEDNAFLFECISKKLKVYFMPALIARLHMLESTWFSGFDEKYLVAKGACFAAMSRIMSPGLIALFALKKRTLFEQGALGAIKLMLKGRKNYLHELKSEVR